MICHSHKTKWLSIPSRLLYLLNPAFFKPWPWKDERNTTWKQQAHFLGLRKGFDINCSINKMPLLQPQGKRKLPCAKAFSKDRPKDTTGFPLNLRDCHYTVNSRPFFTLLLQSFQMFLLILQIIEYNYLKSRIQIYDGKD